MRFWALTAALCLLSGGIARADDPGGSTWRSRLIDFFTFGRHDTSLPTTGREVRGKVIDERPPPCIDSRMLKGQVLEAYATENIRAILVSLPAEPKINRKDPRMKSTDEFARYVSHHFLGHPPAEIHKLLGLIRHGARAFNLPEQLLGCMFMKESSLNSDTGASKKGAHGLSQIMPGTADFISDRLSQDLRSPSKVGGPLRKSWDQYWHAVTRKPAPETFAYDELARPEVAIGVGSYWARYSLNYISDSIGHDPDTLEGWALAAGAYDRGAGGIARECAGVSLDQCLHKLKGEANCETYLYIARVRDCMEAGNNTPLTHNLDCSPVFEKALRTQLRISEARKKLLNKLTKKHVKKTSLSSGSRSVR